LSFRYPDILCNLDKPFIWGPVGGSIDYPRGFEAIENKEKFGKKLRALDKFRLKYDPLLNNTMNKAKFIVVTTNAAKSVLPKRYQHKALVIPEGISLQGITVSAAEGIDGNYIFSSGRFVTYKAFDLLIKAYAKVTVDDMPELRITGDGPEKKNIENLIRELELSERVKLVGKVSKERNKELMSGALFCVFPALNEAFGHVNLEAMAVGKPIITADWGGPADIVKNEVTGFKVLGNDVDEYVNLLGKKMECLITNAECRVRMGIEARKRVEEVFSWGAIGQRYKDLYAQICSEQSYM